MNFQHISIKTVKFHAHKMGVQGLVIYNERIRQEQARQAVLYITREGGYTHKQDLVGRGDANLPGWARDTVDFFTQAEKYGRKNGSVLGIEVALPRELSTEGRRQLADAIRSTYFSHHPQSWAIHNPTANTGREQPHLHMIISRQVDDGIEREPERWFKNYLTEHPERGGSYRYDTFDYKHRRETFTNIRRGIGRLTNHALELEGCEQRVWSDTVHSLGLTRKAATYLSPKVYQQRGEDDQKEFAQEMSKRKERGTCAAYEQEVIRAEAYKTKEKHLYHGLTMEQAVLYERERFYRHDHTPWREREREVHAEAYGLMEWQRTKTYERIHERIGPERGGEEKERGEEQDRVRERGERQHEREIDLHARLEIPLIGNKMSLIYHAPGDPNYGDVVPPNQVRFWSHTEAIEAGYRAARNQEYGAGAEEAMEAWPARERSEWRQEGHNGRLPGDEAANEPTLHGWGLDLEDEVAHGVKQKRKEQHGWRR